MAPILRQCEKDRAHKDIIIVDDIRNCTVDKVAAEQIRHKPGIVCVDYLEEMRTPRNVQGWEGVAANGRGLKQSARVTRTPHVTATQLNREGETSYQSAQKIADMLIILEPPEDDEDQTKMALKMRKYRDGPSRKPVMMHWDLDVMDIHELAGAKFEKRAGLGEKQKQKNPWLRRNGDNSGSPIRLQCAAMVTNDQAPSTMRVRLSVTGERGEGSIPSGAPTATQTPEVRSDGGVPRTPDAPALNGRAAAHVL